jgi:hypothetical protein
MDYGVCTYSSIVMVLWCYCLWIYLSIVLALWCCCVCFYYTTASPVRPPPSPSGTLGRSKHPTQPQPQKLGTNRIAYVMCRLQRGKHHNTRAPRANSSDLTLLARVMQHLHPEALREQRQRSQQQQQQRRRQKHKKRLQTQQHTLLQQRSRQPLPQPQPQSQLQ